MKKKKKIIITASGTCVTKEDKREAEKQRKMLSSSPVLLVLYLLGITGLLLQLRQLISVPDGIYWAAIAAVDVLTVGLWYLYFYHNKIFLYVTAGICVLMIFIALYISMNGGSLVAEPFNGSVTLVLDTPQMLMLVPSMVFILFAMEFVMRRHSIMFLLVAVLLILGNIFLKMKMEPLPVIMMFLFQIGFTALNLNTTPNKKTMQIKGHAAISAAGVTVVAAVIAIVMVPSWLVESLNESKIILGVFQARSAIMEAWEQFSGNGGTTDLTDGRISRGNLRQTGVKLMEYSVDGEHPERTIYLAGFNGGDYNSKEGCWVDCNGSFSDYEIGSHQYRYYYRELLINQILEELEEENYRNVSVDSMTMLNFYYWLVGETFAVDSEGRRYQWEGSALVSYDQFEPDGYVPMYDLHEVVTRREDVTEKMVPTDKGFFRVYYCSTENLYFTMDSLYQVTVYGSLDHFARGNGRSIYLDQDFLFETKSSDFEFIDPDSSDPVGALYAQHGEYARMEKEKDSFVSSRRHFKAETSYAMGTQIVTPYYSSVSRGFLSRNLTPALSTPDQPMQYRYFGSYLDEKDVDVSEGFPDERMNRFIDQYMDTISWAYTTYDNEAMPRLQKLCDENPLDDLNEITTFILYTLQTRTTYSTTPGYVPFSRDTVEYFLFDNHKGYCVHYATAAAMMYRMYGIPCRYVSGLAVDNNDFYYVDDPAGYNYHAEVTDHSAHAWVEIFLKGYGWVPVEVTPTVGGYMQAYYPGYNIEEMNRIMKEHGWKFRNTTSDPTGDNAANGGFAFGTLELPPATGFLILSAAALIAFIIVLLVRSLMIRKRIPTMTASQLYHRIIEALHLAGKLQEMNGSEKDFSQQLALAGYDIPEGDAVRLTEILQTENYSEDGKIPEEDRQFVAVLYQNLIRKLYPTLTPLKKIVFRWIKVLS